MGAPLDGDRLNGEAGARSRVAHKTPHAEQRGSHGDEHPRGHPQRFPDARARNPWTSLLELTIVVRRFRIEQDALVGRFDVAGRRSAPLDLAVGRQRLPRRKKRRYRHGAFSRASSRTMSSRMEALMSPAPRAMTMSPRLTRCWRAAATSRLSATYVT